MSKTIWAVLAALMLDVASVGTDGRLARVVGLLDKVPGGATAND